ncbi:hypothetical protein NC651_035027 [Populus alba x Populus x berolinensis]|nr:hypothetical protein NC651_035027 [Populus alba x Populus x berolinensis]
MKTPIHRIYQQNLLLLSLMIDNTSPIPLAIPPSIPAAPPTALILTVPPRPLVPFPIRPPGVQSGEMRTSDSDSAKSITSYWNYPGVNWEL